MHACVFACLYMCWCTCVQVQSLHMCACLCVGLRLMSGILHPSSTLFSEAMHLSQAQSSLIQPDCSGNCLSVLSKVRILSGPPCSPGFHSSSEDPDSGPLAFRAKFWATKLISALSFKEIIWDSVKVESCLQRYCIWPSHFIKKSWLYLKLAWMEKFKFFFVPMPQRSHRRAASWYSLTGHSPQCSHCPHDSLFTL